MRRSQKLFQSLIKKRAMLIGEQVLPFIKDNDNILDFGCGDMAISEYISNNKKVEITGMDTVDYNSGKFTFIKYKNGELPFRDNEFDVTLAVFVLHHTDNPSFYLRELSRISSNRIILIEDIFNNRFEQIITYIVDWIGNHIESWSVIIPFNYKSIEEWKELFNENNIKLNHIKRFYPHPIPNIPTRNIIMVLEKITAQ